MVKVSSKNTFWNSRWKEVFGFLVLVFIAGAGWTFIPSQSAFISQWFSIGYRFFFSGVVLLSINFFLQKPLMDRAVLPLIVMQGVIFFPINYYLTYTACSFITSGLVALISSMTILPSLMLTIFSGKMQISRRLIILLIASIVGSGLVFYDTVLQSEKNQVGIGLAVLSIIATSIGLWVLPKIRSKTELSVFAITGWSMIIGGISSLTIGMITIGTIEFSREPEFVRNLFVLCLITPVFFTGHYFFAMKYSAATASLVFVAAPVVSLMMSALYESYTITISDAIGTSCVILSGIYLARILTHEVKT